MTDTLLNVFLAIAVDNLANAQELTKVRVCATDLAIIMIVFAQLSVMNMCHIGLSKNARLFCLHKDEEEEEEFFNQRYARGRDGLISE